MPRDNQPLVLRSAGPAVLTAFDLSKRYPNGVEALKHAEVEIRSGEVHGFAGANGAGKSTLVKILGGSEAATSGRVAMNGVAVNWRSTKDAMRHGVITMHQHAELLPKLDVLENVFLGGRGPWRRSRRLLDKYERLTSTYGIWVDPLAEAGMLSTGQRQMVALLQALSNEPQVLVLDEPTASLGNQEKEALFGAVDNLRRRGVAVVLVSHFLDELLGQTDRLTVLRDGRTLGTFPSQEMTPNGLAELITGSIVKSPRGSLSEAAQVADARAEGQGLLLRGVTVAESVRDVDLDVPIGQVLGIAGLLGSGRSELLESIFGAREYRGAMSLGGEALSGGTRARITRGVGFVPEDRNAHGLFKEWDIARNISIPWIGKGRTVLGIVDSKLEETSAKNAIERLAIRADGPDAQVVTLSGGNAQKVVIGRWLVDRPGLLLLDEPMRGIDIGARREIGRLIRTLAAQGTVVVVVDSEFTSLLEVCDRVVALHDGHFVIDEAADRLTEHRLLLAVNGITPATDEMRTA